MDFVQRIYPSPLEYHRIQLIKFGEKALKKLSEYRNNAAIQIHLPFVIASTLPFILADFFVY